MTNIFGRIGAARGPTTLVGAHYDSRPLADRDPVPHLRTMPVPGANDGASGVAVVIEAARAVAAHRPDLSIVFALFDGEDLGEHYYGSEAFAYALKTGLAEHWRPQAAVIADMVGKADLHCVAEITSMKAAPRLWTCLRRSVDHLHLHHRFTGPTLNVKDDHVPLIEAGVPSILLIDYAYPQWHTTLDTLDRCSRESLAAVGDVVVDLVLSKAWAH